MWHQTGMHLLWTLTSLSLSCGGHTNRCNRTLLSVWSLVWLHSDQPSWNGVPYVPLTDRPQSMHWPPEAFHARDLAEMTSSVLIGWCHATFLKSRVHQPTWKWTWVLWTVFNGELITRLVWQIWDRKSSGEVKISKKANWDRADVYSLPYFVL